MSRKKRNRRDRIPILPRAFADAAHDACYGVCLKETEEILDENPQAKEEINNMIRRFFSRFY